MILAGKITARLDAKGRVFLPSEYRRIMTAADARLVVKRDLFQPCMVIYPYDTWCEEVAQVRSKLNRWNQRQAMLFRRFMSEAEILSLDSQGRFIVSRKWQEVCGIGSSVCFLGVDDRLEMWAEDKVESLYTYTEDYALGMTEWMNEALPTEPLTDNHQIP